MRTGPRAIDGEWITSPRIYKTKKLSNARKQEKRIKREHDKMLRMQQRMRNDDDDDDVEHSVAHTGNVKSTFVFVFEGMKATIAPISTISNFIPDVLRRNLHRCAIHYRSAYCRGRDDIIPGLQGMSSCSTDVHDVGGGR